jgi:hypothetical protein
MLNRVLNDYRASNCSEAMEAKVMGVAADVLTPEHTRSLKPYGIKADCSLPVEASLIGVTNLRQISPRARSLISA